MNIDKESKIQKLKNFQRIRKKLKKNNAFELNRKLSIRTTKIINFNRWFKKEHDYCLPFQNTEKIDGCRLLKKNFNQTKILCKNDNYLKSNLKNVNLESINVNNELSSSSLYAINVTTELLKDALIENKKTQIDGENLVKEITEKFQNPNKDNKCFVNKMLENEITTQYQKQRNNDASLELLKSPLSMDIDDLSKLDSIFNFPNNQYIEEQLNCDNENLDQLNDNLLPNFCRNIDVFSETNSKIHPYLPISPSYEIDYNSSDNYNSSQNQVIKNTLNYSLSTHKINVQSLSQQYLNIFNRYQEQKKEYYIEKTENPTPILLTDLLCGSKPKTIISPYTHRHLKPYILKDAETKPLWLKMLKEIKDHYRIKNKLPPCMESETIDYSYVRAKHIKSVNALAREFFWPGIDLTDSLLYPDFSIIALYKNLVVGFGFMVPDISTNENYITFLFTRPYWTNCGIATFMVYHLIQTCMTRDITLHVSPSNPAMFLYQKFGFKIEEFVQDFYDKYIPGESRMSKHALFLRLRSTLRSK